MMDEQTRWELIEGAARALCVSPQASKKWRRRGVPHKWRLPIIQKTAGALTADDFYPIGGRGKARNIQTILEPAQS
ncbi:hypothetical protein C4587_00820 [Candidatus Parcubacteria bacterium]|nr:MAG: hypothetical protein C4587_00820 [Candidatus Parcubacteria bacterium]